jgi:NAD(P)-dependent dehydrogenase (short-subunit alcohol dehydrogenase family)
MGRKSFLITGASSGIGKAAVLLLVQKGHLVFAGVRTQKAMEEIGQLSTNVHPIHIDVTNRESILSAKSRIEQTIPEKTLHGLVNNAAIAISAPMEFVPIDEVQKQMDVNVTGLIAITQAFLPMLRNGNGRIVNVGSLSGLLTTPFLGPYCASKYAVEAITDAMRMELHSSGIKVSLIEPGSIKTPMWRNSLSMAESIEKKMLPGHESYRKAVNSFREVAIKTGDAGIAPEKVALKIAHALLSSSPKTRYLVGSDAFIYSVFKKILPDKAFDYLIYKELKMK